MYYRHIQAIFSALIWYRWTKTLAMAMGLDERQIKSKWGKIIITDDHANDIICIPSRNTKLVQTLCGKYLGGFCTIIVERWGSATSSESEIEWYLTSMGTSQVISEWGFIFC